MLVILTVACVSIDPPVPPPPVAEPAARLDRQGASTEIRLAPGEERQLALPLGSGHYVEYRVEGAGADLDVSLAGPDAKPLTATTSGASDGALVLAALTTASGEHRLSIARHPDPGPSQTYRVVIRELRAARPTDGDCIAARRATAGKAELAPFTQALDLWRRCGEAEGEVDTLNQIAMLHRRSGKVQEAIDLCERAISRADAAGYRRGQAEAFYTLGFAHADRGEATPALAAYTRALQLWTELDEPAGRGRALYAIGMLYLNGDSTEQALDYFAQALPMRQAARDVTGEVNTLIAIATADLKLGRIEDARLMLERAEQPSHLAEPGTRAFFLRTVADFDQATGEDLQEARDRYEEARRLFESLGRLRDQAVTLHNMAALSHDVGDLDTAVSQYLEALRLYRSIAEREPEFEAQILINLGWTQHLLHPEQSKLALEQLETAYGLVTNLEGSRSTQALALYYIGQVQKWLGEPAKALPYLERSADLWQSHPGERLKSLLALGEVYQALGDRQAALRFFDQTLESSRQRENVSIVSLCLLRKATLDRDSGDLEKALQEIEEAVGLIERVRNRVESDDLRTAYFATRRRYFEFYIDLLMRLHDRHPASGYDAKAFQASESARARSLLDLLAEGHINVSKGIDPTLKKRETELDAKLGFLGNLMSRLDGSSPEEARVKLRAQIEATEAERAQLRDRIRQDFPQYASILYPMSLDLRAVQQFLDERTALCEYATGTDRSFLFVVTREGMLTYPLPREEDLEEAVKTVRAALEEGAGRRRKAEYLRTSYSLYRSLLGPAEPALRGKTRLLISPDGPLLILPFDALLTGSIGESSYGDLPYLIRRYAITSIPSASVLNQVRAAKPQGDPAVAPAKAFLAYADPLPEPGAKGAEGAADAQEASRSGERPNERLVESLEEVEKIARLFPSGETQIYDGAAATEESVEDNELLKSAPLVHFATHGQADEKRPYLSGLVLTRTPNRESDGMLRVHEIFNLSMKADLVVLSACKTGLGQRVSGEGLIGLTRAFLYAGADSLVVSLWQVADRSTADLMVDFYGYLKDGRDKVEALQQAKLRMIRAGGKTAHPFYWAPFVLTGDPNSLSGNFFQAPSPVSLRDEGARYESGAEARLKAPSHLSNLQGGVLP